MSCYIASVVGDDVGNVNQFNGAGLQKYCSSFI